MPTADERVVGVGFSDDAVSVSLRAPIDIEKITVQHWLLEVSMTEDNTKPTAKGPIRRILGGKVEKGVATRDGFKQTAPAKLVLPKPTAAPQAPASGEKKK